MRGGIRRSTPQYLGFEGKSALGTRLIVCASIIFGIIRHYEHDLHVFPG